MNLINIKDAKFSKDYCQYNKKIETMELLINNGEDISNININMDTEFLDYYCKYKKNDAKIEIIKLLINNGADIYEHDLLHFFLFDRTMVYNYDIIKYLINIYDINILINKIYGLRQRDDNIFIVNVLAYTFISLIIICIKIKKYPTYILDNKQVINMDNHTEEIFEIIKLIKNKINDKNYIDKSITMINEFQLLNCINIYNSNNKDKIDDLRDKIIDILSN